MTFAPAKFEVAASSGLGRDDLQANTLFDPVFGVKVTQLECFLLGLLF